MKNSIPEIYSKYINLWLRDFKGKGSVNILKPLNANDFVVAILKRIVTKLPQSKIFICTDNYWRRKDILDKCTTENINTTHVTCLSENYVNAKFSYSYDLSICVGLKEFSSTSEVVFSSAKWYLFIIDNDISAKNLANIYNHYPCINSDVDSKAFHELSLRSPVEERRIVLTMDDATAAKYNEYDDYITKTINIFGDFETVRYALSGNEKTGESAETIRLKIANFNGWNDKLDTTIPFNSEIDNYFNPNAIHQYAININNIIKRRHELVDSNKLKIDAVVDIVINNPTKRFIIISKRGETAANITKEINNRLGYEACGDYHDNIEPKLLVDDNGNPVLYKSGINKGKPRVIKSAAISSINADKYEDSKDKVRELSKYIDEEQSEISLSDQLSCDELMTCLSVKSSSNSELAVSCDGLILVSQNVGIPRNLIYRFNNINFDTNPILIYRIYFANTYEADKILNEKKDEYCNIINDENNDENFTNIACG